MTAEDVMSVRERLKDWERREDIQAPEAALRVGYSLKMYEAIKYGDRRPRLDRCLHFQETTGVPASLFYPELRGLV